MICIYSCIIHANNASFQIAIWNHNEMRYVIVLITCWAIRRVLTAYFTNHRDFQRFELHPFVTGGSIGVLMCLQLVVVDERIFLIGWDVPLCAWIVSWKRENPFLRFRWKNGRKRRLGAPAYFIRMFYLAWKTQC